MGCGASSSQAWTDEELEKYKRLMELWDALDKDGSGQIEMKELRAHLQKQGKGSSKKIANNVQLAFDVLDADGSGTISLTEFLRHNKLKITPKARQQIVEMEEREAKEGVTIHRVKSGEEKEHEMHKTKSGKLAKARKYKPKGASSESATSSMDPKSPQRDAKDLSGSVSPVMRVQSPGRPMEELKQENEAPA